MIVSPDAQGQIDPTIEHHLLMHIPKVPIDIVPISWIPTFSFRPPTSKPYVLIDFMETHNPLASYDEWDVWAKANPPVLTFKRELPASEASATLLPCEFTAHLPAPPLQTKEQYDARPINVLYFWGYSHRSRPRLHADIFRGMANDEVHVCDNWADLESSHERNQWATIYSPHWRRKPMSEIACRMREAKICVAMPGNGYKTFRHTECRGTLLGCVRDEQAWAYPWTNGNSVQLEPGDEYESLCRALSRDGLYERYLACHETMKLYEGPAYGRDYIAKSIMERI